MAKPRSRGGKGDDGGDGHGNGDRQPPRRGNPDADPVRIHREYIERRLGGGEPANPAQYERAQQQWQKLPGAISRPPTTVRSDTPDPEKDESGDAASGREQSGDQP